MGCSICNDLERALKSRRSEYITARSATFCRVSTRFVAYNNVEMERARSELEMHRSVCIYAVKDAARLPLDSETWKTASVTLLPLATTRGPAASLGALNTKGAAGGAGSALYRS